MSLQPGHCCLETEERAGCPLSKPERAARRWHWPLSWLPAPIRTGFQRFVFFPAIAGIAALSAAFKGHAARRFQVELCEARAALSAAGSGGRSSPATWIMLSSWWPASLAHGSGS